MSVAMTNCGAAGWVTDRTRLSLRPARSRTAASHGRRCRTVSCELAATPHARRAIRASCRDACLINRYEPGARLTLHQDKNERDFAAADRLGIARPAGDFPVRRPEAQRPPAANSPCATATSPSGAARRASAITASPS